MAASAAFWLFDEVGVRGEWAMLKYDDATLTGLNRGIWYPIRSHNPKPKTVVLGSKEVEVNIKHLRFRADIPVKTVVFSEGNWADYPRQRTNWVAKCPRGHRHELGQSPPARLEITCQKCEMKYEWEYEWEYERPSKGNT